MSKRAVEFLEEWVSENMAKPVAGAPEGDDSEARLRAVSVSAPSAPRL
jgi:hypothetical protein